eukprot:COSAG03_NODE_8088_length_838_cov_0.955345_1_plen_187_part_10
MALTIMLCALTGGALTTFAQEVTCDLAACTCAGRSLAYVRHTTWDASPVDRSSDYAYRFSICDPIPQHELPVGCQQNRSVGNLDEKATVVKYKRSAPLDCIELGSAVNMTGRVDAEVLEITYSFAFGCMNAFTVAITDKAPVSGEPADLLVTQGGANNCTYSKYHSQHSFLYRPPPSVCVSQCLCLC